jgi:RNAse (barnase) inhibitor barstar
MEKESLNKMQNEVLNLPTQELENKFYELVKLKGFLENSFKQTAETLMDVSKEMNEYTPSHVFNNVEKYDPNSFNAGFFSGVKIVMKDFSSKIDTLIEVLTEIKQELEKRSDKTNA